MAYGAMREQMEQTYGANYEQEWQRKATVGVNPGVVNTAIYNIAEIAEGMTVDTMATIQKDVINLLMQGWITVSGKDRIERITEAMNTVSSDVVAAVTEANTLIKESAEKVAWEGLQERISINLKTPSRTIITCEGVKDNDNGSYYIIAEYLDQAKDKLATTIMPNINTTIENMKKAASKSGLYDKDGSLQGQIDNVFANLYTKISEGVTGMITKINESLTYNSSEAYNARAAGELKLAEIKAKTPNVEAMNSQFMSY